MSKMMSDVAKNSLPSAVKKGELVDVIAVLGGWRSLSKPTVSTELVCPICDGRDHYVVYCRKYEKDQRKVWVCANGICETNTSILGKKATTTLPDTNNSCQWPLFCEINGIGDIHHAVRFENVDQSDGKIKYLREFADQPRGLLVMYGDTGTGKTYSAMATCELFIRKDPSCIFLTQKQLLSKWLEEISLKEVNGLINKVNHVKLLVVDDFGTGEVSPGFMGFFMDLINTRLQWTNRGTIISTNLKMPELSKVCGQALSDRIKTGQKFEFIGRSRRHDHIL